MYEVHGGNRIGRSNLDAFEVVEQQREVANAIELDPRDINDEMAIATNGISRPRIDAPCSDTPVSINNARSSLTTRYSLYGS